MSVQSIDDAPRRRKLDTAGGRVPPHNLQAERSLLGAMLLSSGPIETAAAVLAPSDFYLPAHSHIFETCVRLWRRGDAVDPVTVGDDLERAGLLASVGGSAELVSLVANTPSTSSAGRYAGIVVDHSRLRQLIAAAGEIAELGYAVPDDVGDAIDRARALMAEVDMPVADVPADATGFDEFLDRPRPVERTAWLIPGLIRRQHRAVFVAPEGAGKSFALRAFVFGGAAGVHPFGAPGNFAPIRTLLVDLENPEDALVESCAPIREQARRLGDYDGERVFLWHRPGGIDLRRRADRAELEAVIRHHRPQLVCLGPLYKSFRSKAGEQYELVAGEVQDALDDLRTRYDFALVLEHHAPKAVGRDREMAPAGSARWLYWPEFGIKLLPQDDGSLAVKTFRHSNRVQASWPDKLQRGINWPWSGTWNEGMPRF